MNIFVTGGGRGIGAGIVRELAEKGHNVAFCGRNGGNEAFLAELRTRYSGRFACFRCDVSHLEEHEAVLDAFEREIGPLDMLVNNAGVAPEKRVDVLEMPQESFDRVMAINLRGPFFLTQAAAKRMIASRNAPGAAKFRCIVNVSSISADYASISRGEYCLSKAGISMATKLWSVRLAQEKIAVYEIRPGVIHSDMTSVVTAKYDKMIADGLTLQPRWGEPADVGRAVAMLAGGALEYSTGQVINVDGGMTIERL